MRCPWKSCHSIVVTQMTTKTQSANARREPSFRTLQERSKRLQDVRHSIDFSLVL